MGAQAIIEMEGKKTRILNIKVNNVKSQTFFCCCTKACCNFMKLASCGVREYGNIVLP